MLHEGRENLKQRGRISVKLKMQRIGILASYLQWSQEVDFPACKIYGSEDSEVPRILQVCNNGDD